MDLQLKGKRALVTGSGIGIGAGLAVGLAAEGCELVVTSRNADSVAETVERIKSAGGKAVGVTGDLTTTEGVDKVTAVAGQIDILVNNAGGSTGSMQRGWLENDDEDWIKTFECNTLIASRMIRKFVPGMKERRWGRVIQIASMGGIMPMADGPAYTSTKASIINLSASLSRALAGTGITSNTVSPGIIKTHAALRWFDTLAKKPGWEGLDRDGVEKKVAREMFKLSTDRIGAVADITHVVVMLASPASEFITGINIRVDGGRGGIVN